MNEFEMLALAPGSIPSVLRALCGVSIVPALFVALEGVKKVVPQMMCPLPERRRWNLGELCSVILYIVNFDPVTSTRGGTLALPGEAAIDCSQGDMPPAVGGSPP